MVLCMHACCIDWIRFFRLLCLLCILSQRFPSGSSSNLTSALTVVFRLVTAPAVNPLGLWDLSASLCPLKVVLIVSKLWKKIETATFFCKLEDYGALSCFDRNRLIYTWRFCHQDVK